METSPRLAEKMSHPYKMDFRIAELFKESSKNSRARDAQHVMQVSQIPDLGWKIEEVITEIKPVIDPESIDSVETPHPSRMYVALVQNRQMDILTGPEQETQAAGQEEKEVSTIAIQAVSTTEVAETTP